MDLPWLTASGSFLSAACFPYTAGGDQKLFITNVTPLTPGQSFLTHRKYLSGVQFQKKANGPFNNGIASGPSSDVSPGGSGKKQLSYPAIGCGRNLVMPEGLMGTISEPSTRETSPQAITGLLAITGEMV